MSLADSALAFGSGKKPAKRPSAAPASSLGEAPAGKRAANGSSRRSRGGGGAAAAAATAFGARTFAVDVKGQAGAIPQLGLGTAGLKGDVCAKAVAQALRSGYKYIDTALLYGNQEAVGEGIRASGAKREDVFVVSKVAFFPSDASAAETWMFNANNLKGGEAASVDLCLEQLGLEYVDLLLVHNPCTSMPEYKAAASPHHFELFRLQDRPDALPETMPGGAALRPIVQRQLLEDAKNAVDKAAARRARVATWRALERVLASGKARMIGVSNYPPELLLEMKEYAKVMPAVNQLELHPRFSSPRLRDVAAELGCVLTGYGLCHSVLIERNGAVRAIAQRLRKTAVEVVLRWCTQRGVVAIPRSQDPAHQAANLATLGFTLDEDDLAVLDALDEDYPYYWWPTPTALTTCC